MVPKNDGLLGMGIWVGIIENENGKLSTGIYTSMYVCDHSQKCQRK